MAGRQQPKQALLSLQALQVADFSSQKLTNRLLDHGLQSHAAAQRAAGIKDAGQPSQQGLAAGGQDAVRELLQVFIRSALAGSAVRSARSSCSASVKGACATCLSPVACRAAAELGELQLQIDEQVLQAQESADAEEESFQAGAASLLRCCGHRLSACKRAVLPGHGGIALRMPCHR